MWAHVTEEVDKIDKKWSSVTSIKPYKPYWLDYIKELKWEIYIKRETLYIHWFYMYKFKPNTTTFVKELIFIWNCDEERVYQIHSGCLLFSNGYIDDLLNQDGDMFEMLLNSQNPLLAFINSNST